MKSKRSSLSPLATASFCRQLAMLLNAGVSAHESLLLLKESSSDAEESRLYERLSDDIGRGQTLHQAMERSGRFMPYVVEMVRIGETSGRTEDALDALSRYYLRNENLRQTAKNAMVHPLVMLCLLIALVAVLLVRVLPVFAQVYAQLGTAMSPFAAKLMALGQWLGKSSLAVGAILILTVAVSLLAWKNPAGKRAIQRFAAWFPLSRSFVRTQNASRFCFAMALMLKSGMSFDQAVGMAWNAAGYTRRPDFGADPAAEVSMETLLRCNFFDASDARLLQVGARVGKLDTAMEDLAERSEEKSNREAERLVGIIDPVMVTLMGVVAGMVLLSVMLPLLSIMAAI